MAKITLRTYLKEIETQIERGEIDQAIAHAKNIIRAYPKHIDSYRLLGKAYLESQRYSEALDILQRVLSVIPDDFISQIGVSIIREDEGNLDAAIWHMERAYEVQPFNPAIQDELRRLYGRRDGVEPPKIRLTRGALVRMYMRGELYPQAIAEIRAALVDDPQRYDLLVLLARLYNLSNQRFEATEVCSTLISKLPFCFEANQILAEILPGTSRAEDAKKFQQRIYALDPYAAFISPSAPTSSQVPDQAVMVEHYEWNLAGSEEQSPEWTKTIGVAWEETQEEELPDWINTLKVESPEASAQAAAIPSREEIQNRVEPTLTAEPIQAQDELVPDWMKEAGWAASDRPAEEIMAAEEESEEILPANIPTWLQSKAPEMPAEEGTAEAERTDWLETILNEPEDSSNVPAVGTPPVEEDLTTSAPWAAIAGAGEMLTSQESDLTQTNPEEESGWMPVGELPISDEPAAPDWLIALEQETNATESSEQPSVPDWLAAGSNSKVETPAEEAAVPDWLKHFGEDIQVPASEDEAVEQLKDTGIGVDETAWSPGEGDTETMDWLKSIPGFQPEDEPVTPSLPSLDMEIQPPQAESEPDFIPLFDQESQPVHDFPAAVPDQATEPSVPEWLSDFSEVENEEGETAISPKTELVGWEEETVSTDISGLIPQQPATVDIPGSETEFDQLAQATQEETQTVEPTPDFGSPEDAMAWLESLAARQGADEATLITRPEDRQENPPEWLIKEIESGQEFAPGPGEQLSADEIRIPVADENRQPLLEMTEPVEEESVPAIADEGIVQNVQPEMETDFASADEGLVEVLPVEMEAEILSTGEDTAEGSPVEMISEEAPASKDFTEVAPGEPEAAVQAGPPELSDMDAAMAWLEGLAARQGADEATLTIKPEDRIDTPPGWVIEEIQKGETEVASSPQDLEMLPAEEQENAAQVEVEIPDWIAEITRDEEESTQPEIPTVQEPSIDSPVEIPEPTGQVSTPAGSEPEMDSTKEFDSAFAWLESLAARQGAEEGTLITKPEERVETPPEWLQDEEAVEEAGEPGPQEEEVVPVPQVSSAVPDWLQTLDNEETQVDQPESWLTELEQPEEETESQPEPSEPLPAWLQESGKEQDLQSAPVPEGAVPDWLASIGEEEEIPPYSPEIEPALQADEFRSAWEPETIVHPEDEKQGTRQAVPSSLEEMRSALDRGDIEPALEGYNTLIQAGESLPEIIKVLRDALYRYPVDIDIWQSLGDAYSQNNQLQEAIDAYTKAEELLR